MRASTKLPEKFIKDMELAMFCPMFFRHFEELWAPTFLMHEEYFLSKQLSEKGFRVYYEPSIKVQHRCRGAMRTITGRKAWEAARSAQKVYRQHVKIFS